MTLIETFCPYVGELDPENEHADCFAEIHHGNRDLDSRRLGALVEFYFSDEDFPDAFLEALAPLLFVALPVVAGDRLGCDVGTATIGEKRFVLDRFVEVEQAPEMLTCLVLLQGDLEGGVLVRRLSGRVNFIDPLLRHRLADFFRTARTTIGLFAISEIVSIFVRRSRFN